MVRYYCDYCDTFLTHDSVSAGREPERREEAFQGRIDPRPCPLPPASGWFSHARPRLSSRSPQVVVRKQHNSGFKHKVGVEREERERKRHWTPALTAALDL
jgi:hypothetical protein